MVSKQVNSFYIALALHVSLQVLQAVRRLFVWRMCDCPQACQSHKRPCSWWVLFQRRLAQYCLFLT